MLTIQVTGPELYDEDNEIFIEEILMEIQLEHSLVSVSKWESKFEKAFLSTKDKSTDEILEYVQMMCLTPDVSLDVIKRLDDKAFNQILDYINSKQTATFLRSDPNAPSSSEIITSELIYYWMISLGVPFECQHWHLQRLLTLIKVCSVKNSATKKMSRKDLMQRNRSLNAQRKQQLGTRG